MIYLFIYDPIFLISISYTLNLVVGGKIEDLNVAGIKVGDNALSTILNQNFLIPSMIGLNQIIQSQVL